MHPTDLVENHFRLTGAHKAALKKLGIHTIRDLLFHFPSRYESISESGRTDALVPSAHVTLYGTLKKLKAKKLWQSKRTATEGVFEDSAGKVKVLWFNQPYLANMLKINTPVKLSGTVTGSEKNPYIANPEVSPLSTAHISEGLFDNTQNSKQKTDSLLFPVYPESRGVTSRWFYHAIKKTIASGAHIEIEDVVPKNITKTYNLPPLASGLVWIHLPEKQSHCEAARKRFAFEEIFTIHVARQLERHENQEQSAIAINTEKESLETFVRTLPFSLTGAQKRAINEIAADFEKPHPMARLLEGDVGSGKTAVAAATSYAVVTSKPPGRNSGTLQVAYMAPTEILARQHFQSFIEHFEQLPINIGLITGSGCYKFPSKINCTEPTNISRSQLLKWVRNGEIAMLIGTHALIQKSVEFQNLAYVIIDEQHRFGTRQRAALAKKHATVPHFLSMTATPIPRTLALTMYGDLDISVLDELPPGRALVATKIVSKQEREHMYKQVCDELNQGRQAYVICARIEEADPKKALALRVKSAKEEAKRLQKEEFANYRVGLLHGKMKPAEKDAEMEAFAKGDIDILVATSVVEVGINVPNATVIVIEGAERFGLAQLHQLRGRVQRSTHKAFCFLSPEKLGEHARKRLRVLEKTQNGFKLAEHDLEQRGAGDLYGIKQWGISDIGMEALKNPRLIEAAQKEAFKLVNKNEKEMSGALKMRAQQTSRTLHEE